MKDRLATRPCAEFPCDNPRLLASEPAARDTGVELPPLAVVDEVGEFEWANTDYWVKEVKRRWAWAALDAAENAEPERDAPEVNIPVLEALTLDDEEVTSQRAKDVDPFIAELMGLLPGGSSEELLESLFSELEESGETRALPGVQHVDKAPASAGVFDFVPNSGVQPLLPLQLELTPTPGVVGAWSELTETLSRYLLNQGHTRAAALLTPMLNGELVELSRLEPAALERLVADSVAELRSGRAMTTRAFRDSAKAFREEFSAGGLNAGEALFWLGQLVVALCGGAVDDELLESHLREAGVAQLLEKAA